MAQQGVISQASSCQEAASLGVVLLGVVLQEVAYQVVEQWGEIFQGVVPLHKVWRMMVQ